MTDVTTDPKDPRLTRGVDTKPSPQAEVYLISPQLPEEYRSKAYIRPLRTSYTHTLCGQGTVMGREIAETYARDPKFYGATYCVHCKMHLPVSEFVWNPDGETVGS